MACAAGSTSVKKPNSLPRSSCSTSGAQYLAVCGTDELGGCEHLRLRFQGHLAQIRLDLGAEGEIESPVDPGDDRVHRVRTSDHPLPQPARLHPSHVQEHGCDEFVLRLEMPIEGPRAEAGAIEHLGHAQAPNAMLANEFRRGRNDGLAHPGVGIEPSTGPRGVLRSSGRRVVRREILAEALAHALRCQTVISELVDVFATRARLVPGGPRADARRERRR